MGWYEQYSLDVGLSKLWDDPGNNRTRIRLYVNVYAGSAYYQYYGTDAYIHIDTGGAIVEDNGTNHGTGWTPWAIARPTQTSLNGNNQTTTIWYGDYWLYHDSNGYVSYRVYGSFESWGTWGTPTLTDDTGWTTAGMSDYNRSAKTPYYDDITRAGDGNISHFYTHFVRTGNVDSGETSYTLERATNQAMNQNYSTFSEGHLYDYDQYKAYWFRMYASGNEGGNKYSTGGNGDGTWGPYYGRPYAPGWSKALRSPDTAGKIDLEWGTPSNNGSSGYGNLQYYHIYRNGVRIAEVTGNSFSDTGLARGSQHSYEIYALGSWYWSPVSATTYTYLGNKNIMAPGVPSTPGIPTVSSKIGRTVTINSTRGSTDYGNTISEYRIQLSTDNGATWKGWDNTAKTFTANNSYNVLDGSGNFTYTLLTPALTYKWRVFAVNSIGTGDIATMSSGTFVSAGGRRFRGTGEVNSGTWQPTENAKRYTGTQWVDLTVAKKYDPSYTDPVTGSHWKDLT